LGGRKKWRNFGKKGGETYIGVEMENVCRKGGGGKDAMMGWEKETKHPGAGVGGCTG